MTSDRFERGRIPSLDGLRAIAILLVIAFHASHSRGVSLPPWALAYTAHGAIGVDVFFAISGFLITTLLLREERKSGCISLGKFYGRRAIRILPAFVLYLLVVAIVEPFGIISPVTKRDWIGAMTYTINFMHPTWTPVGHIWSLSVEEHFYLAWPLIIFALGSRRAAYVAAGCLVSEPVVRWMTWTYARAWFDINFVTFTRLDAIAAGCLLAFLAGSGKFHGWDKSIARRAGLWFTAMLAAFIVSVVWLSRSGKYSITIGPSVNAILICGMLYLAARFDSRPLGKLLNWPPLVWIGGLSYSLYLWQQFFLDPHNRLWIGVFPMNIVLALAAAAVSYYAVELPFLRLRERMNSKRDFLPSAPATAGVMFGNSLN